MIGLEALNACVVLMWFLFVLEYSLPCYFWPVFWPVNSQSHLGFLLLCSKYLFSCWLLFFLHHLSYSLPFPILPRPLFYYLLISVFHSNLSPLPSVLSVHHHPVSIPEIGEPLCSSSLRNLLWIPFTQVQTSCLLFQAFHILTQYTSPRLSSYTNLLHGYTTPARSVIHAPEVPRAFFSCAFFFFNALALSRMPVWILSILQVQVPMYFPWLFKWPLSILKCWNTYSIFDIV